MTVTIVNLRAEGIAEAGRLGRARAVVREDDQQALDRLEADASWIAVSRRGRVRRALRGRACLVWRAAFEDASGRTAESRLVSVTVDAAGGLLRDADDDRIGAFVEAQCEGWRSDVVGVTSAFSAARLTREEHIAAPDGDAQVASQPGLFDRRVERLQQGRTRAAAADAQALTERRDQVAAAAAITRVPARLMLVLLPSPC